MYPKWNPGKWKHGLKPAVPWWFHFDPYPFAFENEILSFSPLLVLNRGLGAIFFVSLLWVLNRLELLAMFFFFFPGLKGGNSLGSALLGVQAMRIAAKKWVSVPVSVLGIPAETVTWGF